MGTPIQVLILEDRAADAELLVRHLQGAGFDVDWQRVDGEQAFRLRLVPTLDVILADYSVPGFGALEAMAMVQQLGLDVPIVVVSGSLGDQAAMECIRRGALDYVLKDRLARLGPAVQRVLLERRMRGEIARAQEELRRREGQIQGVLGTIEDVVFTITLPEYRLQYMNPAIRKMFGRHEQAFYDNPRLWLECVHPEDRAAAAAGQEAAIKWGTSQFEYRLVRPDGAVRNASVRCWVSFGPDRRPVRIEGIVTDVTDRRIADEERLALELSRREGERLAQLSEFKSRFLAMVAHDLNNVLTPMRINVRLLEEAVGPASKPLHGMKASIERLAGFLADLLDATRLQAGELPLEAVPLNLAALVTEALDAAEEEATQAGLRIVREVPAELAVVADRRRIEQVATNLLSNALKFTPRGGLVEVRLAPVAAGVLLSVRDTGPGIAAADLPKLFQPFARLTALPQGRHTGTGLGLFICRGIAERHGGRIWCESEGAGKGAAFHVELPLAPPPQAAPPPVLRGPA